MLYTKRISDILHLCSIKIFTYILAIIYRLYDFMTTNLKLFYDI